MTRIRYSFLPLIFVFAALSLGAQTQPDPVARPNAAEPAGGETKVESLTTDRAEYTVTTEVVGTGVVQLETGFLLESIPGASVVHAPVPLLRIGLTSRLELRTGGDGGLWQNRGSSTFNGHVSGLSDMGIELKWKLMGERGYRPALAIAPSVSTPVGRSGFTSGAYDPTVKLAWAKGLPKGFHAAGNFNVSSLTEDGGRFVQRAASLCIEHNLPGGLVAYWENYNIWPRHRTAGRETMWNSGLFRGIGKNAQIDVEVARCFASVVPHWFVGAGLVVRLPGALWGKSPRAPDPANGLPAKATPQNPRL